MNSHTIAIICLLAISLCYCKTEPQKNDATTAKKDSVIDSSSEHIKKVKVIFYNVPTPLETSTLLQRAGAKYNADLMNSTKNQDKYTTNISIAVNLGIYGADLSYSRMFDQIQETINYLSVIKKFSAKLGIPQDEKIFAVNRIEANIDNRDSLLRIISETYSRADAYLKQNEQGSIAAYVILGGWVETLYIATHITDKDKPNKEIFQRIAEQRYSLANLISLVELYKGEETMAKYFKLLEELKKIYDKMEVVKTTGEIVTDEKRKTTVLNSKSQINITAQQFVEVQAKINELRSELVK